MKNTGTNFKEYFEDIVGVSFQANSKPIKIMMQLDNKIAPYIFTKPLHGLQKKIESNDKGLVIQIEFIPNQELKHLLLSYGNGLEILSPKSFRMEFFITITRMNKEYNKTETL